MCRFLVCLGCGGVAGWGSGSACLGWIGAGSGMTPLGCFVAGALG